VAERLISANVLLPLDFAKYPTLFMAFNNMLLGYINLAPLYQQTFHIDLFSEAEISKAEELFVHFAQGVLVSP